MTETRPVPDHLFDEKLSASRIKEFAQCPLKWWFDYAADEHRTKPEKGYRELGTAVHEAIEDTLLDDDSIRDSGTLSHRFKRAYRDKDPDVPEWMYDRGLNCCDNAAKYIEQNADMEFRGFEVEHQYHIGGEVNKSFNAKMDIVTDTGLVDWKTGKRKDSDGDVREYRKREELIQGMVYAGAYLNKYGEHPEYVTFVYLGDGEIRNLQPTEERSSQMKQYARALLQAMGAGEFPAKTGGHCSFCD
jgi:CRISPR/Cas system-associated exonuclease Cas4 (RecB family)